MPEIISCSQTLIISSMTLRSFPSLASLSATAAQELARLAKESIAKRGRFTLALSGGKTPQMCIRDSTHRRSHPTSANLTRGGQASGRFFWS